MKAIIVILILSMHSICIGQSKHYIGQAKTQYFDLKVTEYVLYQIEIERIYGPMSATVYLETWNGEKYVTIDSCKLASIRKNIFLLRGKKHIYGFRLRIENKYNYLATLKVISK